jgi:hypothetical protein
MLPTGKCFFKDHKLAKSLYLSNFILFFDSAVLNINFIKSDVNIES